MNTVSLKTASSLRITRLDRLDLFLDGFSAEGPDTMVSTVMYSV